MAQTPRLTARAIPALATWSGGKDSCFAVYTVTRRGFRVTGLLNATTPDGRRSAFQDVPFGLIRLQARRMGLPLYRAALTNPAERAACLLDAGRALDRIRRRVNFNAIVSGHNNPADPQRKQMLDLCRPRRLKLVEPHVRRDTRTLLESFLKAGFRAIIAKVNAERIDPAWLGRPLDAKFIDFLVSRGTVNFCGDDEYQSLVLDGPLFKKPIDLVHGGVMSDNGWQRLVIQSYR